MSEQHPVVEIDPASLNTELSAASVCLESITILQTLQLQMPKVMECLFPELEKHWGDWFVNFSICARGCNICYLHFCFPKLGGTLALVEPQTWAWFPHDSLTSTKAAKVSGARSVEKVVLYSGTFTCSPHRDDTANFALTDMRRN
jgi:hypothetical protein